MKRTTIPNEMEGTYVHREINTKAEIFPEMISLNTMGVVGSFNQRALLCENADGIVQMSNKLEHKKMNLHALVVVFDERGHACVYDSHAQRGGKGTKTKTDLHRLMLAVVLAKALPGLVNDLTWFYTSLIRDEGDKDESKAPLETMTTKAVWKLVPEWLKKMHNELKCIRF